MPKVGFEPTISADERPQTESLYTIKVMCGFENKQRLFPYTALTDWFFCNRDGVCLQRGTDWIFVYNSGYVLCVDLRTSSDYFPIQP